MKPYEILAPAGDMLSARAALSCGADAVYLGLSRFSARSSAENFGYDALRETATYAHLLGAKVYVCLNTLIKDEELSEFFESVAKAWEAGADAVLMQDMLLGKKVRETYPEVVLHLSTQAGCCNERGAEFAKACGFSRVVLARETPLSEIGKISKLLETEVFVQGALCTCFSGQCYLSSFAGNNSGNRGRCKQPCRKKYSIDREGYGEFAYALSLSDLSVGRRVEELLSAGVISLKIEGRMRRPEYVAAAVTYYRTLLEGENGASALSDLKRAYNRGDYTAGLAFGQERSLLSRKVQGHIGEKVGEMRSATFCASDYVAQKGDGFKILRGGREVGGALFRENGKGGFFLTSRERPKAGDEVRLTTETALPGRLTSERKRELTLSLNFVAGERASVSCGDFSKTYDILEAAKRAPLTAEELMGNFAKTDGLPFAVSFDRVETAGAFLPKSALNALRRDFFRSLISHLLPVRESLEGREVVFPAPGKGAKEDRTAIVSDDLAGLEADILIYKPRDFRHILPEEVQKGKGEKFLYLPPFFSSVDEALILPSLSLFDGIYCDGYYGLPFAKAHRKKFFAGTGWNLTNAVAVMGAKEAGADLLALSKELTLREQDDLADEGVFSLDFGGVKVMDLCYCPFEKSCDRCDRRDRYFLTDEEGRRFPLRRYRAAGDACRFEVYNCALLRVEQHATGRLFDLTGEKTLAPYAKDPDKAPLTGVNRGHANRSML